METKPADSSNPGGPRPCPCGSGRALIDCCGPILAGERQAATAEELMRARFTAHATHDFAFVHRTYSGTARLPYAPSTQTPPTEWTRLVVHSHTPGPSPDVAHVDFSAYGREAAGEVVLHERAEFERRDGAWIYTRPLREGPAPFKSAAPKPGRNDPCPCGSGRKYKHCCLVR